MSRKGPDVGQGMLDFVERGGLNKWSYSALSYFSVQ